MQRQQQPTETDLLDVFSRAIENPEVKLQPLEQARLERLKAVFARWMANPLIADFQMRDYIVTQFSVGRAQAYRDIVLTKALFGSAPKTDKEFQRARANRILEKAYAAAEAGDAKQAKALTKIAETLIKANQLDEQDDNTLPWDQIIPQDESFSVDPSVIGIEKVPGVEERARKLLKQYTAEADQIDEQ